MMPSLEGIKVVPMKVKLASNKTGKRSLSCLLLFSFVLFLSLSSNELTQAKIGRRL
jgi:hypothetical protein